MSARDWLGRAVTLLVLVLVVAIVLSHALGQPILLGFVATDSMAPTMDAGDGFVAVPDVVAGDVEAGDVVVFQARELHDGGLTTHRVVEVREDGYVTKGDANPFTDQDGPEPVVTDEQVVAHALQLRGSVVTIPLVGTIALGVRSGVASLQSGLAGSLGLGALTDPRGFGTLMIVVGIGLLAVAFATGGRGARETVRSTDREQVYGIWTAVGVVALLVVVLATAAMVVPAGVQEYGLVSTTEPIDDPLAVEPGGTTTLEYTVDNAGVVPAVAILDPHEGVAADPGQLTVGGRSDATASVSITVPEEEGVHYRHLEEHRYLLVLPPGLLAALHGIHPLFALLAVDAVVGGFVLLLGVAIFGTDDIRMRSTASNVPLSIRLQRFVSRWL